MSDKICTNAYAYNNFQSFKKVGQTIPNNNKCMKKSDAVTLLDLNTNLISSYTNNQLLPINKIQSNLLITNLPNNAIFNTFDFYESKNSTNVNTSPTEEYGLNPSGNKTILSNCSTIYNSIDNVWHNNNTTDLNIILKNFILAKCNPNNLSLNSIEINIDYLKISTSYNPSVNDIYATINNGYPGTTTSGTYSVSLNLYNSNNTVENTNIRTNTWINIDNCSGFVFRRNFQIIKQGYVGNYSNGFFVVAKNDTTANLSANNYSTQEMSGIIKNSYYDNVNSINNINLATYQYLPNSNSYFKISVRITYNSIQYNVGNIYIFINAGPV